VQSIEQQRTAADAEREQRIGESASWPARQKELRLRAPRRWPWRRHCRQAQALRQQLAAMETQLKTGRARSTSCAKTAPARSSEVAKLRSDLEHLEASCLAEVNVEAQVLRADAQIARLAGEPLAAEEETCRALRQRIEQMGPVNMMALDEYKETAERHGFLETQRKDLMESIENTQETIKEIDQISRTKFDEAFARSTRTSPGLRAALPGRAGLPAPHRPGEPGRERPGHRGLAAGQEAAECAAALGRRKVADRAGAAGGIFQFQPSPFCVLDEVDAALDETNVGRLADLLHSLSKDTQFLLVTHSKRMMQSADMIYGVTMQEPGVSKVVSVRLD
jgi:chromosome segregation protein